MPAWASAAMTATRPGETMAIYYRRDRFRTGEQRHAVVERDPSRRLARLGRSLQPHGNLGGASRQDVGQELLLLTPTRPPGPAGPRRGHQVAGRDRRQGGGQGPAILGGDFNSPTDSPIFRPLVRFMKSARDKAPESDNEDVQRFRNGSRHDCHRPHLLPAANSAACSSEPSRATTAPPTFRPLPHRNGLHAVGTPRNRVKSPGRQLCARDSLETGTAIREMCVWKGLNGKSA